MRNINEERDKWKCTGGETARENYRETLTDYNIYYTVRWFFFDENFNSSALFSGDSIHYSKTPGGSTAVKYCILVVRWRGEVEEESCLLLVVLAIFLSFLLLNFNPPAHNHDALVVLNSVSVFQFHL